MAEVDRPGDAEVLPAGVSLVDVPCFADDRGLVAELSRRSGLATGGPVQWNLLSSRERALRGMHVHPVHTDWLSVVAGEAVVGLFDLRRDAGTPGLQGSVPLSDRRLQVLTIPPGVLHGVYTPRGSVALNGMSHEYDPEDDIAVRFDDPAIDARWIDAAPTLSERDRCARSLSEVLEVLSARGFSVIELAG